MKENTKINKRYEFLDLLKCMAICFVIIYHCSGLSYKITNLNNIDVRIYYFILSIISVCVPIFFFVNGALILNKKINIKRHIEKTLLIIFLTLIWSVLTLLIQMVIKHEFLTLKDFVKSIFIFKQGWTNHLWFMKSLILIYVFFPAIKYLYDNYIKYLYLALILLFLFVFGKVFLIRSINDFDFLFGINKIREYGVDMNLFPFVYFILGGIVFKYKEVFQKKKYMLISCITIFASMIIATIYGTLMMNNKEYFDIVWNGYVTIPTLLSTVSIFILSMNYNENRKIHYLINLNGVNTLGIYFVHYIFVSLVLAIFKITGFVGSVLINFIFAFFILGISLIFVLILKKIPLIRKLVTI